MADSPENHDAQSPAEDEKVEQLARELAERLRAMPNRQELTDFAVSLLKESNEEAGRDEQARESVRRAAGGDPFNPIAFGIPLLLIGAVLCATGLLAGIGLGVIALAIAMVAWGIGAMFIGQIFGRGKRSDS